MQTRQPNNTSGTPTGGGADPTANVNPSLSTQVGGANKAGGGFKPDQSVAIPKK